MSDDINCLKNRQPSQQTFTAHQFLLCNGLTHTNKNGTNSYKPIDYETICTMASNPDRFDKERGFATILSTYRRHDGREHDVQREHGSFGAIAVDVDDGNCELQTLKSALSSVIGNVDHVIYSTSTAKVDDKKYRAIIPFADPHPYSEIEYVTKALFDRLDEVLGGQVCDRKMENPGQVSFLPNVPFTHTKKGVTTQYRGEDGKPFFYEHQVIKTGQRFDPLNCSLTEQAKALQEWEVTNQAALAKQRESQAKALQCMTPSQAGTPIDLFNQQFKVADLLIKYGYQKMNGRYLSQYQESGIPATVLSDDGMACFIHSQSDIDEGIGRRSSQSSCNFADGFDLFTHYEHKGDQKAALRAAALLLGLNKSNPLTDLTTGEITMGNHMPEGMFKSQLADEWVLVTNGDMWFNTVTGQKMTIKAFNLAFKSYSPPVMITPNGQPTGKRSITNEVSVYLISYCGAVVVSDLLYMPLMEPIFELDGLRYANLYMKTKLPNTNPDWQSALAPKLIEQHLRKMFANESEVNYFIKWMGWIVQNPGVKVRWLPLIIGAQGDAKSQLGIVMGLAMGSSNVKVVSQQELHENFTGWKYGHCLAVLEELKAVGKSRHDVSEKLKEPVTNNVISVLRKGRDGINAPNTQNYLALTNHRDAVIIEQDDRRWFVMETVFSQERKSPLEAFSEKYWDDYFEAMKNENGSIRGWLLSIDTAGFDPNRAPPSSLAKDYMKTRSRSSDSTDLQELIDLAQGYGYTSNVVATDCIADDCYRSFGNRLQTSRTSTALSEIGFIKYEKLIKWKGKPRRVYVKPNFLRGCIGEDSKNIRIRKELDKTSAVLSDQVKNDFAQGSSYEHDHFK